MLLKKSTSSELMPYYFKFIESPVGNLKIVASDKGLAGILWEKDKADRVHFNPETKIDKHPILLKAEKQLAEYFANKRTTFDIPLDFKGTPFQKSIWEYLVHIPFGETRTYGQLAKDIGYPKAVRAVGAANGQNPIAIIAGCHRVIGANGTLTGFAGGLDAKAFLLKLENCTFKEK